MKIELTMKCHKCQTEHTFGYDTNDPFVYIHDTETMLSMIDIVIKEEEDKR